MIRVTDRYVRLSPRETQAFRAYHLELEKGLNIEQAAGAAKAEHRHLSPEFWAWLTGEARDA